MEGSNLIEQVNQLAEQGSTNVEQTIEHSEASVNRTGELVRKLEDLQRLITQFQK